MISILFNSSSKFIINRNAIKIIEHLATVKDTILCIFLKIFNHFRLRLWLIKPVNFLIFFYFWKLSPLSVMMVMLWSLVEVIYDDNYMINSFCMYTFFFWFWLGIKKLFLFKFVLIMIEKFYIVWAWNIWVIFNIFKLDGNEYLHFVIVSFLN